MNKEVKTKIMIEDEIVLLTTRTLHNLYQIKNGADAVSLYCFYYYTAKWQGTNQPKADDIFCMNGLGWGKDRLKKAKKILERQGLIQRIMRRKDGKIAGWYIKLNYIWKREKAEEMGSILEKREIEKSSSKILVEELKNAEMQQEGNPTSSIRETNACNADKGITSSADNINAFSVKKEDIKDIASDVTDSSFDSKKDIEEIIDKIISWFKGVNPMYSSLRASLAHRKATERLHKSLGAEMLVGYLRAMRRVKIFQGAPVITNPVELEMCIGKLDVYCHRIKLEHHIDLMTATEKEFEDWVYEEKGWVRIKK